MQLFETKFLAFLGRGVGGPVAKLFMPLHVACRCGAQFAARDDLAGKTVACPACGGALSIPAIPIAPPPAYRPSGVTSILDEIGLNSDDQGIVCPKCQGHFPPGKAICAQCGYNLQTGSMSKPEPATGPREKYDWKGFRERSYAFGGSVVDEDLTMGDLFVCGFCGGLAFIYGLVLFLQGRSKGILLMLASLLVPALVLLGYAIFRVMITVPPPKPSSDGIVFVWESPAGVVTEQPSIL